MKKKYLILSVFAIVFTVCETDFDVNAEWEETTVVFGLLDAAKDIQLDTAIQQHFVVGAVVAVVVAAAALELMEMPLH